MTSWTGLHAAPDYRGFTHRSFGRAGNETWMMSQKPPREGKYGATYYRGITHLPFVVSHTLLSWDHTPNHVVSPTG